MSPLHLAMLALAGAGMVLTAYLTGVKLLGATPLSCDVGSSCDLVQSSRWSVFLGVPLAGWGLATYALVAGLLWRARKRPAEWRKAWFVALVGFALSVNFTAVSVFEIEATCPWCLASAALMTALFVGLTLGRPRRGAEFELAPWLPVGVAAAAVVIGGMHLHYRGVFDPGVGPEKPYLRELALHLEETGARFYGAYWCPHCQDQKALFEASEKRLPYVECTPEGRGGPRNVDCLAKNINSYPTWIIQDRRYETILEPEELARLTRFTWKEASAE